MYSSTYSADFLVIWS